MRPEPSADASVETGLRRSLGLGQITASGVGIIIGAGVYVLIGAATELAGARVWIAFILAAVLSALTGLSYAELASMFPYAGAEFEYARHAYPAWLAFLIGWTMFVGLIVAAAAVALGFGTYMHWFVDVPPWISGLGLLAFVAAVALSGIRRSARLTVALSLVQVGGLVYVIAIGVPHIGSVSLLEGNGTGAGGVLSAAALVFFAFIGFDEVITLAEETKRPTRTVPLALLLSLGISTLLYVGVAVAAVSVLGAEALGNSDRPLADVLDHALGGNGAAVLAVLALIATTNTTLLCLTASSRLQYGMAHANALPRSFAKVGARSRAPWFAILVSALAAAGFVLLRDLALVASVTDFAVYLVFLAVNVAVILLRRRMPDRSRPFRAPGSIKGVPITPILGLLAVLVMLPALRWEALALGVGACGLGLVAYAIFSRH
jgi:APA family basic amino acid/polyamine antiporter